MAPRGSVWVRSSLHLQIPCADGAKSCLRDLGTSSSLVSVSGPIEVRPAAELPSQAALEVSIRPLAGLPGTDSKALSSILKSILSSFLLLSQHPRTLVQVVCQALSGNETGSGSGSAGRGWNASLIASLVNASTAALLSASSVPMNGVVCAVAIGRVANPKASQSTLILDPSEAELPPLAGGGCFAFLISSTLTSQNKNPSDSDVPPVSLIWTNYTAVGPLFDESELAEAQRLAEVGATEVWRKLKESIRHKIGRAHV